MRNWALRSALIWMLLAGLLLAMTEITFAVAARDTGWEPGPFSAIADLLAGAFLWVHLSCAVLSLVPAYWWQRMGGSATGVLGLAYGIPLWLLAVLALRRGTESWDGLFILVGLIVVIAVSFVGALAIRLLVPPRPDDAQPTDGEAG